MRAIIISIGDELILGQVVDTNAAWLSARMAECGVLTSYHKTVPDDLNAIVHAVCQAKEDAEWVLLTGGLGPTPDDLTRQALAEALQTELVLHGPSLKRIESFFHASGRTMSENNRVQAMYPRGSEILDNSIGTAPGLKVRLGMATVFAFPGVPMEMKAMFENSVIPLLSANKASGIQAGRAITTATLNTFGFGESKISEKLEELMARGRNPTVGTTASGGIVSVRIRSDFDTVEKAHVMLEQTVEEIRQRLGKAIFGHGDETLQDAVGQLLLGQHKKVVTAESCTAGLLGKMLTEKAGASAWYVGGWIVYDNELKVKQLGIPEGMISREGSVSKLVVKSMAEEAVKRASADRALALTGIAGPGGGTSEKPVGTIWIALGKRQADGITAEANRFVFSGNRESIRDRAAKAALNLLRLDLIGSEIPSIAMD